MSLIDRFKERLKLVGLAAQVRSAIESNPIFYGIENKSDTEQRAIINNFLLDQINNLELEVNRLFTEQRIVITSFGTDTAWLNAVDRLIVPVFSEHRYPILIT